VSGNHTWKFGGNFHYDQITTHLSGFNNGSFDFTGTETGNDYADFLIGAPATTCRDSAATALAQSISGTLRARQLAREAWLDAELWPALGSQHALYETNNQLETIVPGLQSVVFPGAPRAG